MKKKNPVCCRKEDYNEAFNFSSKPGFLNKCGKTTKGTCPLCHWYNKLKKFKYIHFC